MSATLVEEQVSLKLVIDKDTNKVLFAEAEKDFVDILCSFLTFSLGTIARLVGQSNNIGCLNSLYKSVSNLDEKYLSTATCKEMLLRPRNSMEDFCRTLKVNIDDSDQYFMCSNSVDCYYGLLSTFENVRCLCGEPLDRSVSLERGNACGFVKGGVTFIITDDLIVKPNSMETNFGIIHSFGIKNTSSVKQLTVNVTKEKVMDLLKCSLFSKSALTDLFLESKHFLPPAIVSPCSVVNNNNSNGVQIKVHLFVRKSDGKILLAQGEEDFADFILSLLTFPLGGVVRMLEGYSSLGCIDGLYKSMNGLNGCKYFMSDDIKNQLVDPSIDPPVSQYYCYFQCSDFFESLVQNKFSISNKNRACSSSEGCVSLKLFDPESSRGSDEGGYVKGPVVFMATDDLVVTPVTPISALSFLDRLQTPPSDLEEKIFTIGYNEGLSILKAALTSTSALTNGLRHLLTG